MPSAAILAGGNATRFGGRDKSALVVGGRTILARQVGMLSQMADDILIVGSSREPQEPDLIARVAGASGTAIRYVVDRTPGRGPLGGLDAALAAARHSLVIVLACDMPFVTGRFVSHLLKIANGAHGAAGATATQGARRADVDVPHAVVPRTEGRYHPLCAVYSRACQRVVRRRLAEGRLALNGLFDEIDVAVVEAGELDAFGPHAHLLANVNTPSALETLDELQGHET